MTVFQPVEFVTMIAGIALSACHVVAMIRFRRTLHDLQVNLRTEKERLLQLTASQAFHVFNVFSLVFFTCVEAVTVPNFFKEF